ncbi:hypothetical protein C923_01680, partial [Plasmodium falciparum UGT5.1]
MGPPTTATSNSNDNRTARDILEGFGAEIQKKAHADAVQRGSGLKGVLSNATYPKDKNPTNTTPSDPCGLDHQYHTNVTGGFGRNYPCANRSNIRFSDKYGGQCTDSKIKGNDDNTGGACAPLRRLFLCDHHLSHMEEHKINDIHNLLLEVSLAAKYEGTSLVDNHKEYTKTHGDFDSNICTVLARSFADIGDIIRGKDLFIGYNQKDRNEKAKLQENLTKIFNEIYNGLNKTIQSQYNGDAPTYYKLREDWWNANRKEIWKAMTCVAPENAYIIKRRFDGGDIENLILTHPKCGHDTDPPVVDYIPQRLRWMSEWSEYFCNVLNKEIDEMNNQCKDCEMSRRCNDDSEGGKCKKCKEQCQIFKELVSKWKNEFDKQSMKYKELYIKASTNITKQNSSSPERGYRRNHRRRGYDDDTNVQLFLKK